MRMQCQKELNEAQPALIAAREAAKSIDKNFISSIKTYSTVTKDIENVVLAINLIFDRKETWKKPKSSF
jgi:hypothetical protein